ncbi:DUF1654 domain-containing protein [Pseudomonas sp. ANT_H14]|nr:DUF1654 domain-containing protein [Pseudomonas sp. ANT_H4]KAA0947216.1 DUF1654 domain-containing protein [Pseudomonas sp. ANT_H14]
MFADQQVLGRVAGVPFCNLPHQRWVTIHRLDTDEDREREEVMGLLSETDDLDITLDDDGAVTVRWKAQAGEDSPVGVADFEEEAELAPF